MRIWRQGGLACGLFFLSLVAFADDQDVLNWSQQILLQTLTVNYTQTPADFAQIKLNYSRNAWAGLSGFLSDAVEMIREDQLSLHPKLLTPPELVQKGNYQGIDYWRINMLILVPELNKELGFSLLVIKTTPTKLGSYMIQSLDILKFR